MCDYLTLLFLVTVYWIDTRSLNIGQNCSHSLSHVIKSGWRNDNKIKAYITEAIRLLIKTSH